MEALEEIDTGGVGQGAERELRVDALLDTNMSARFKLEIAALLIDIEIVPQSALDVPRPGSVALDQIRVVAVHHSHEVGETGGSAGMKPTAEPASGGRQLGEKVEQPAARFLQEAGLDASGDFDQCIRRHLPIFVMWNLF
jgi:hypothetical protein